MKGSENDQSNPGVFVSDTSGSFSTTVGNEHAHSPMEQQSGEVSTADRQRHPDQCSCSESGFCQKRQRKVNVLLWKQCQSGNGAKVDALLHGADNAIPSKPTIPNPQFVIKSNIGAKLAAIIVRETGRAVSCAECDREILLLNGKTPEEVLLDTIPLSERIVKRAAIKAPQWYQRAAAKFLPGMVASSVRQWIVEACGIPMPKAVLPANRQTKTVCGCVHDGTADAFMKYISPLVPGVERGNITPDSHRRIIDTLGYAERLLAAVVQWNGGTERPAVTTPWLPGTWMYGVTTVPSRATSTLATTLRSLSQSGFDKPILFVDSPETDSFKEFDLEIVSRSSNLRSFAHWHLTLLELYSRNPWANYYAIFQDDFVCCRNLKEYLTKCPYPEKGYMNLLTFMENEVIVSGINQFGWIQAHTGNRGTQLGRGAVALVFSHEATEALLTSGYLVTRTRDSVRGYKSIDGAVVTAMNQAGWKEYIHNPSLIQHTGIESSMGNKKHPLSKCFSGEEFNPLTLL